MFRRQDLHHLFPTSKAKQNNKEFWAQTRFENNHAPAYDKIDRKHPEGRELFLTDLNKFNLPKPANLPILAHRSKVNPDLLVTNNQWVISLTRKKDHAVMLLETVGYGDDEGLFLRWFDYVPKNKPHAPRSCFGVLTNFKALENKMVDGMVRYCPTNKGKPLANIPASMTKKEIFTKLNWNEDTDSWVCSPSQAKAIMDNILKDFLLGDEGKLKFKFCGHSVPNCTTWTWHKLEAAGIHAENDNYQNKFIVRASKNTGTKRHR